ncbi:MAG: tetratricopeptide repeat protein [Planctomycetes bacterium]|nr:tetratricopeptide repeat protein [Planctomycetota bacterium]
MAKQIQGGPDLTGTGQILGTASYMAPEQAAGRRTDPRSDVYAIGAILYELLVGRPPFRAETAFETLRQVQELDPVTPLVLNPKMDHDLETISLKALTKDPSQRYQTAQQMAEDLGRWLNGEPIRARPIRRVEKLWRWAKRNARVAWLSAAVLALLLVVATGSPVALVGIALERRAAVAAQKQAETKAVIARSAQRQAEHNAAEALEAQRQAQKQAAIAESARRVSDEQSALALEGFSKLVYELHDLLKNQPSLRPMGEQLLDVAVQGLQKVARPTEEAARIADHATVTAQFKLADLLLILARTQEAEERLEEALRICEGSFEANPNNDQAKRDLSLAYSKRGDLCLQTGKTAVAKKYYSKVRDLQTELARDNANVCSYQRDLGIANIRLGDVSVTLGEPVAAREYFQNSLEIFQHLAAVAPADAGAQRDLSVSYERLGKLHDEQGEPAQALEYFHKSLAILDSLAVAGARDVELRRTSSVTHEKIAQASRKINDPATAEKHFTRCLELRQQLLETDPANAVAKRDLATAYEYLGALAQDRGNHEEARDHFRKSLQLREELVLADPSNAQVQRELGVIREKLGDVSLELDDVDAALQNHRMALELREELAAQDPKNVEAQRDLSISYRKLGSICARHGNYPDARQYYRKALVIREKLVAANPQSIQANLDMAATCDKFGDLEKSVQQPETALQWYERALPILRRLETEGKFQCRPQMLQWIAEIDQKRLTCSVALRAIDDIQFALEQPREIAVEALVIRAVVLARRGLHDEVMVTSEKLLHIGSADANHLYNVACCFSLCAAAVVGDKPPEHLSSDDQAIRSRYAAQAIESLTRAVELGFKDVAHMEADPDFAAIRHELGYRQLVDRLRSLFPATLD